MDNLKPGDTVTGIFQNCKMKFKVSKNQLTGPEVYLEHDGGDIHVRRQDIRNAEFELEVRKSSY